MVNSELQQKLSQKEGSNFQEIDEESKKVLVSVFDVDAVDFLIKNSKILTELTTEQNLYSKKKFVLVVFGRVVELNIDTNNFVDIHFSMADDFITNSENRYERTLDSAQQRESLKFMRFMDTLFSKVKKDIPLTILASSEKRGKLMKKIVKKYGLSNVLIGNTG